MADRLNLRFYSAMPNLLTGCGILGTFIGLVAGIYLASRGLASDDASQVRQALQELLGGASLAFLTSIAGLFSSLAFSSSEKRWIHRIEQALANWNETLERRIRRVTAETIQDEQLREMRQQTTVLESFTTDLAVELADRLGQRLDNSAMLGSILEALEGLRADRGQQNEEVLRQLLEQFSQTLSAGAGQEFREIRSTLESLNEQLRTHIQTLGELQVAVGETMEETQKRIGMIVGSSLKQMQEGVGESIAEAVGRLTTTTDTLAHRIGGLLTEAVEGVSSAGRELRDALDRFQESARASSELNRQVQETLRQGDALIRSAHETGKAISRLATPLEEATRRFDQSAGAISTVSDRLLETGASIDRAIERLEQLQGQIRDAWQDYAQRFEGTDEALAQVFTQLEEGLENYTRGAAEFMQDLDSHTAKISQHLASASRELTDSIEELSDRLRTPS